MRSAPAQRTATAGDALSLTRLGAIAAASVYLLLGSEWLFLVTKPSMFSLVGWPERCAILLAGSLAGALAAAALAILIAVAWRRLAGRRGRHAAAAGLAVPAVVLSAGGFLLVENFTRTLFGFNVGSLTSPARYLYALGWLLLAVWLHRALVRLGRAGWGRRGGGLVAAVALLAAASGLAAWVRYEPRLGAAGAAGAAGGGAAAADELPNVLIFSSDGVNASHMSVYGYEVATTPFLDSRVEEFLLSENHFSNALDTAASIGALLSGKPPGETGVLAAGDVFRGRHVFEHLPGLLRQLGYYNIDISTRYYGDAYDMNLRQGFHVANARALRTETLPVLGWMGRSFPAELYFVSLTLERLRHRLLHAFGVADMQDFFDVVAKRFAAMEPDHVRLHLLRQALASAPRPFFAHVHLLGTHNVPSSSAGGRPESRYEAAIRRYDGYLRQVVAELEAAGELDRTLLIVNSDHDTNRSGVGPYRRGWARLPLMIRFPGGQPVGRISENTQRIDIAPTILAHLGIEPPAWMRGRSLIGAGLEPRRLILASGLRRGGGISDLTLVQCQEAFRLDVWTMIMERHLVAGHTSPCAAGTLLEPAAARGELMARLPPAERLDLPLELQLQSLQRFNDPEIRQGVAEGVRAGRIASLALGEAITVAGAHADFWTDGTRPAMILLRNAGERPRAQELLVGAGQQPEYPVRVFVQDDRGTREHLLAGPATLAVELGPVAPGGERLYLVWTDHAWAAPGGGERRGVRLLLAGAWLRELLRRPDAGEWRRAARLILDRRVPTARLGEGWLAANVHGDRWTRGDRPAGLAVRNEGAEPLVRRLVVRSGAGHRFPLRFTLHDGSRRQEHSFDGPGALEIELPAVPPRSERLFILRAESGWRPQSPLGREVGVRLLPRS